MMLPAGSRVLGEREGGGGRAELLTTFRNLRKANKIRTHKSLADNGTAAFYCKRTMGPLYIIGAQ
jgi:hypothetical protein